MNDSKNILPQNVVVNKGKDVLRGGLLREEVERGGAGKLSETIRTFWIMSGSQTKQIICCHDM